MQCTFVPTERVKDVWLEILPYVRKLVAKGNGRVTELSLFEECLNGEAHLWISFDDMDSTNHIVAFIMTKVRQYPKKRLLSFEYIGGERIEDWFSQAHDFISQWAQVPESQGGPQCDGVQAIGRLGWVRYLKPRGWEQQYCIYERMFDGDPKL
jgi:hypothetical protein